MPTLRTLSLPRSRPEDQGVPSAAIARLVTALDGIPHVHTLTAVRHGHVVAEFARPPYDRDTPHAIYSVSKSFTSIAVGIAVDEGRFGLDDRVSTFSPDVAPAASVSPPEGAARSPRLTMTTGHDPEPEDWELSRTGRGRCSPPTCPTRPGTHWLYNTAGRTCCRRSSRSRTRRAPARLPHAAAVRAARHSGIPPGAQSPTGRRCRRVRSLDPRRGARCLRPAAAAAGPLAGQAAGAARTTSIRPRAARSPTARRRRTPTGTRATDSSSGGAATARIAVTGRSASTSSSSPSTMRSSP